jgi:tryptophan synthase alpha chain
VDRIAAAFATARGRAALMPYLMAGFPDIEASVAVATAYAESGADLVELGVPFSDPLADGPTIQDTTTRALENGADLDYCLELAAYLSERVPVVFLIYCNAVFARGTRVFLDAAARAGVSGLVIPDLPAGEVEDFAAMAEEAGVALCPLVAPTSSERRIEQIGNLASGFVYCVSVAGVTGTREALPPGAVELLRRVRSSVEAPAALGFGIGSVEAAVEAAHEADGVIIGSKLMQIVEQEGVEAAGAWLGRVHEALSGVTRGAVGGGY